MAPTRYLEIRAGLSAPKQSSVAGPNASRVEHLLLLARPSSSYRPHPSTKQAALMNIPQSILIGAQGAKGATEDLCIIIPKSEHVCVYTQSLRHPAQFLPTHLRFQTHALSLQPWSKSKSFQSSNPLLHSQRERIETQAGGKSAYLYLHASICKASLAKLGRRGRNMPLIRAQKGKERANLGGSHSNDLPSQRKAKQSAKGTVLHSQVREERRDLWEKAIYGPFPQGLALTG